MIGGRRRPTDSKTTTELEIVHPNENANRPVNPPVQTLTASPKPDSSGLQPVRF
jgi:hypothetical protein